MSDLSSIVNVQIDLSEPIVGSQSFGNILILGDVPGTIPSGKTVPPVGAYSNLSEVEALGWVTTGTNAEPVGIAARVAFSQNPRPSRVYIATRQTANSVAESWTDTVARALTYDGWYVLCPALGATNEGQLSDIAAQIETTNRMMVYTYVGASDPISTNVYYRTAGFIGKEYASQTSSAVWPDNAYLGVAAAVKCLSYTPGSETWAFKSLSSVVPSVFSTDEITALETAYTNYYESVAGKKITRLGKVKAGEWIDVIRFRDWLQNDMQVRVANVFVTNPKVPYTNPGISLVENAMIASLKTGQANGGISPDEYTDDGTLIPGYVVSVPDATEITAAKKRERILEDCKFSAYLAGAIHAVEIHGSLGYWN